MTVDRFVLGMMLGALLGMFATMFTVVLTESDFSRKNRVEQEVSKSSDGPYPWNVCERLPKNTTHMQAVKYANEKWGKIKGTHVSFAGKVRYVFDHSDEERLYINLYVENTAYDTHTTVIQAILTEADDQVLDLLLEIHKEDYVQVTGIIDGRVRCERDVIGGGGEYSIKLTHLSKLTEEQYNESVNLSRPSE